MDMGFVHMKEDVKLYIVYERWVIPCISGIVGTGGRQPIITR
jgi:hypothetical protein